MLIRRSLAFAALALASGCLYHARENTDQMLSELVARPYDQAPAAEVKPAQPSSVRPAGASSGSGLDAQIASLPPIDVQTTAYIQQAPPGQIDYTQEARKRMTRLKVPEAIPGSEAPIISWPGGPGKEAERRALAKRIYAELSPLPAEPKPLPGPEGHPYTLAELQTLATANSPQLRQAVSDVEAARGNLRQARAYPNPTVGWLFTPSSDGSTPSFIGLSFDQVIKTGGKLKLQAAAAEMDLRNAELALRRARSDLATAVRNNYFAVLVSKEAVRVNKALVRLTDEVYLLQIDIMNAGVAAYHEPYALRAQARTARLAYQQAISTYLYNWKSLVAVLGLHQLPLTEVAGRIDHFIPTFDFDTVLKHALVNHTDVLSARNGIDKADFLLRLARVTPYPDVEFNVALLHDFAVPPFGTTPTATVSVPIPIWDQNQGSIRAAEAALVRASEQPHVVENNITNNLANAYTNYKNAVDALESYRKYILPDQVQYYRGIMERRQADLGAAFGDLVQAQQTLAANVGTYLTGLGQLWMAVVGVADFLQTDDLFQLAQPKEIPELPDFQMPPWPCPHESGGIPVQPAPEGNKCCRPVAGTPAAPAGGPAVPQGSRDHTRPVEVIPAKTLPQVGN